MATGSSNKGQFKLGNPGKPAGARHRATLAVEKLLEGEAKKLTRKCIEAALGGDMTAMRLCMERIAPPRKGRAVPLNVPTIDGAEGVRDATVAILRAVTAGEISSEEAQALIPVVDGLRRAIETVDLSARLDALEQAVGGERR